MKLVDILARELRAWPKGFGKKVGQCHHGAIHSCGLPYLQGGQKFTRCDNYMTDVVSRGQWQAAVDALKAEKVVEWNGEGLPPVGTVCEWRDDDCGPWASVEVRYLSEFTALLLFESGPGDCEGAYSPADCQFRPIRTPEQIAAEERRKEVIAIGDILIANRGNSTEYHQAELIYDAGYRKFEIVDN